MKVTRSSKQHQEMRDALKTWNSNRGGNRRGTLVQGANEAMQVLKYEIASELGLVDRIQDVGYENMTTKECGSIGGLMTRRMIAYAQAHMRDKLKRGGTLENFREEEEEIWDEHDEEETEDAHPFVH